MEFEVFQCFYSFIKSILHRPRKWIPNLLISYLGSLDNIAEHHNLSMKCWHSIADNYLAYGENMTKRTKDIHTIHIIRYMQNFYGGTAVAS